MTTDDRDVQIHIHEHVGPLRERVGKLEGRLEVQDRELTLLRQGLDSLRDRIDGVRNDIMEAFEEHTVDEIKRYQTITVTGEEIRSKVDALKNWVLALFAGAAAVFAILEFLVRSGILVHG